MHKYTIDVVERYYAALEVEAESKSDAKCQATQAYREGRIEWRVDQPEFEVVSVEEEPA